MCSQHADSTQGAIRVFAHYLRALDAGEAVDIEALCAEHPSLAAPLRDLLERWRAMVSRLGEPGWHPDEVGARLLELFDPEHEDAGSFLEGLTANVDRLRRRGWDGERFDERGEVARGAMGRIERVWDRELRRTLAKKVLLERRSKSPDAAHESTVRLARFLEEAQITAQLDHPGIVPVHDLGVDEDGKAFFTMRLVRGEDLRSVFEKVAKGEDGWTLTRALGVLAKLCEALAFAHSKGVVHRDLKPANVMVGRFGEVYAMDWGLARVMDRPDSRDLRVQHSPQSQSVELSTARTDAESSHGSPLRTMDGHVVGTPAYMPPEQARGELELLGPRSDVYAVGAMLYHLLSGHMPYLEEGSPTSPYEIWAQVRERPPKSIRSIARDKPPELVAICEKAMARDPQQRYADVRELREDLQRFLENRVVRAYRTGPSAEALKWARRNPLVAGSLAALLVVSVAAGVLVAVKEARRASVEQRASDEWLAPLLAKQANGLWPIHPSMLESMREWLDKSLALASRRAKYQAELNALRSSSDATPVAPREATLEELPGELRESVTRLEDFTEMHKRATARIEAKTGDSSRVTEDLRILAILDEEIPRLTSEIERAERRLGANDQLRFATYERQQAHDRLAGLVEQLGQLESGGESLFDLVSRRRNRAEELVTRTLIEPAVEWEHACREIRDPSICPQYEALELPPQLGLVPLRRDPDSGMWEFWLFLSGERPEPLPDGGYRITPESGIVLVLVPGGDVVLGVDPESLDPRTEFRFMDEVPKRSLALAPYFISKYELTQGQWLRLAGTSCGDYWAGTYAGQDPVIDLTHPVQGLRWSEVAELLARWGMRLPSEAQWEHAARGGLTPGKRWYEPPQWLKINANLFHDQEPSDPEIPKPFAPWSRELGDVYIRHAPVGFFRPNAWGLYDMIGNVAEWCSDGYLESGFEEKNHEGTYDPLAVDATSGEMFPRGTRYRVLRGGSYEVSPAEFRFTGRTGWREDLPMPQGGARPSMAIRPEWKPGQ